MLCSCKHWPETEFIGHYYLPDATACMENKALSTIYIEHEQYDLSFSCKVIVNKMEKSNIEKAM